MATRKSPASSEKKTTIRKAPVKKAAVEQTAGPVIEKHPSYQEIAQLAEQFWIERGRPFGSPEIDWLRAESKLYV